MPTVFESQPVEYHVERSRFVGLAFRMKSESELDSLLSQARNQYPSANHYTWAYRLGEWSLRATDDGEPQGTAGFPMLHILERENWEETLVIVVRYFGGIKLGRGGLIRAYQHSAQSALGNTVPGRLTLVRQLHIHIDYPTFERVHRAIEAQALSYHYEYGGEVSLKIDVENALEEQLIALLNESGHNRWSLIDSKEAQKVLPIDLPGKNDRG